VRVQAYVTREEYAKIRELASNMKLSVGELVKRAVVDIKRLEEEAYEKGFNDGFDSALDSVERDGPWMWFRIEEFTVPCPKCGKPMLFSNRFKEDWERNVRPVLAKAFSGWAHVKCLKKVI
jgi:hypothetical protein